MYLVLLMILVSCAVIAALTMTDGLVSCLWRLCLSRWVLRRAGEEVRRAFLSADGAGAPRVLGSWGGTHRGDETTCGRPVCRR